MSVKLLKFVSNVLLFENNSIKIIFLIKNFKIKGNKFIFEMVSLNKFAYVAIGLSTDKIMNEDSSMECVKKGDKIEFFSSFTGEIKRDKIATRDGVVRNYIL
mgnify:CR=1 FL=1